MTKEKTREEREADLEARKQAQMDELWPDPGRQPYWSEQELYQHTHDFLETNMDPTDNRHLDVLASAVFLSGRQEEFDTVPYIHSKGPPNTGKSRTLELMAALCHRGFFTAGPSAASIFQSMELFNPLTLIIDELDTLNDNSEASQAKLAVLNSGYRRGVVVPRASREGGELRLYRPFGLKLLGGTRDPPDTFASRTIRLDMARNIRRIPLSFKGPALELLKAQFYKYWDDYRKARKAVNLPSYGVEPEWLSEQIGDNRLTELFLPLYCVCPTEEGRANLLSLAKEMATERGQEAETGEMAEVLEAIWKAHILDTQATEIPLDSITSHDFETKPQSQELKRWVGWRLSDLGLKRVRRKNVRYVVVGDGRRLERLVRQIAPSCLRTTDTTETTEPVQETLTAKRQIHAQSDVSDVSDVKDNAAPDPFNRGPSHENGELRLDPVLVKDYTLRIVIPVLVQTQNYATVPQVFNRVTAHFGPDAELMVLPSLDELAGEGKITPGPFRDTWVLTR